MASSLSSFHYLIDCLLILANVHLGCEIYTTLLSALYAAHDENFTFSNKEQAELISLTQIGGVQALQRSVLFNSTDTRRREENTDVVKGVRSHSQDFKLP